MNESNPYAALFPRNEHPDQRTNAEYLRDLKYRQMQSKLHSGKWYRLTRGRTGHVIRCITNGKQYTSIRQAANELKADCTAISKHLQGHRAYSHVAGFKFERL